MLDCNDEEKKRHNDKENDNETMGYVALSSASIRIHNPSDFVCAGKFEICSENDVASTDHDSDNETNYDNVFLCDDDNHNNKNPRGRPSDGQNKPEIFESFSYTEAADLLIKSASASMKVSKYDSYNQKRIADLQEKKSENLMNTETEAKISSEEIKQNIEIKQKSAQNKLRNLLDKTDELEDEGKSKELYLYGVMKCKKMIDKSGEGWKDSKTKHVLGYSERKTTQMKASGSTESNIYCVSNPLFSSSSDNFVRRGALLRLLIQTAINKITCNIRKRNIDLIEVSASTSPSSKIAQDPPRKQLRLSTNTKHLKRKDSHDLKYAQELAREKMSTCTILERVRRCENFENNVLNTSSF